MPGRVGQLFSLNIFIYLFFLNCILYLIRIYLCDIKKKMCDDLKLLSVTNMQKKKIVCVCDIPSIQSISKKYLKILEKYSKKLKVKNLISQNIRTFPKINKKKGFA